MKFQILGTGCAKCHQLAENTRKAARGLDIDFELEQITDILRIIEYGVMATPALVVNGKVVLVGKVASPDEIRELLR